MGDFKLNNIDTFTRDVDNLYVTKEACNVLSICSPRQTSYSKFERGTGKEPIPTDMKWNQGAMGERFDKKISAKNHSHCRSSMNTVKISQFPLTISNVNEKSFQPTKTRGIFYFANFKI